MGTKVSCIRPRPSPIDSFVEQNDDDESTHSSGFGKVVTTVVPHDKLPGDLQFNLPLQGETAIALSQPSRPAACALDWRSLNQTGAGEGFILPVSGIDLSGPLGRCLPELIENASDRCGKKSKVMEWAGGRLAIWLYTRVLSDADWEAIERTTFVPILRMREMGLADDQIAKALKPGPFRNAVMAGHVEFHGTALVCTLEPPQLVECVQSCVTQLVDSGLYHLAALMLHQNWDAVSSSDLWQGLGEAEEALRDRLDDIPDWGDDDEPRDLAFHRLKSRFCTLLCASDEYDPVQAGHIVMADLLGRTDGKIRNYQEMVMSALLDLVDNAEAGQRLKNSLIGNLDEPPKRVRAWLQPLDNRIATLAAEE